MFNGLNDSIKQTCKRLKLPKFEVKDYAPNTFEDLMLSYSETNKIIVWSGESDKTIFQDASVNYLFRAWHDFEHIKHRFDFSLQGETQTALRQMSQVGTNLGRIIEIEVIKQAEYYFKYNEFIKDQTLFMNQNLRGV